MTNKKEKPSDEHRSSEIIENAKKDKRRRDTRMKLKQKRVAEVIEPDPLPPLMEPDEHQPPDDPTKIQSDNFYKTIISIIKRNQETVRARTLIARLNDNKIDQHLAKKRPYTSFYQSIRSSTSLLHALQQRPEFAAEIVSSLIKEQEKQVGFMIQVQKDHRETLAKLAKTQGNLIAIEKFIYTAEELKLTEICRLLNTAPTRLVMSHKIMGGMNPVNTIMSPKANPASPFTGPKTLDLTEKFGTNPATGGSATPLPDPNNNSML